MAVAEKPLFARPASRWAGFFVRGQGTTGGTGKKIADGGTEGAPPEKRLHVTKKAFRNSLLRKAL